LAGTGSALHTKHGVYVQHVGIVTAPDSYQNRLIPIFPAAYRSLRFFGLDAYDRLSTLVPWNAPIVRAYYL